MDTSEEPRDRTSDDLAVGLERVVGITHNQHRLGLDLRRLDLDVQRLDATIQLMGTSVSSLSEEVRRLGAYVQRLETKLDLNKQIMDFHLHTIMNSLGVPFADTMHSRILDAQSTDAGPSPAPREVGG
jgi:hypothetical protein